MKRVFAILIAILLIVTTIPITAFAETTTGTYGVLSYEIVDGEVYITGCDYSANGEVSIPTQIENCPVVGISNNAFYEKNIIGIELHSGIKSIGSYAFYNCDQLTTVTIPYGVERIYSCAFSECDNLKSINIPDSVTQIGESAFSNCSKLKSVLLSNALCEIDGSMFYNCSSLEEITIPDGVYQINNNAFSRCVALRSVSIPKNVNSISNTAFAYCTGVEKFIVDVENSYYSCIDDTLVEAQSKTLVASTKERIVPASEQISKIGSYALSGENSDTNIFIPINITYVAYSAIDEWDTLETVWFQGVEDEKPQINTSYDSNNLSTKEWLYEKCGINLEHSYNDACDSSCGICEYDRDAPHVYDNNCDTDCNECEYVREFNGHDYNSLCDADCNSCGFIRSVPEHEYSNICDANCNYCGKKREVPPHVYDNACDEQCNNCNYIRSVPEHVYIDVCDATCGECGYTRDDIHIYDNACDEVCNNCDFIREVPEHNYGTDYTCDICKYSKAPAVPSVDTIYADSITLQTVAGLEYSIDMINWQSSPVFSDLEPNTTYTFYQRVAESYFSYVSESSIGLVVATKNGFVVEFDANGGEKAPYTIIKTEGISITLSEKPTRSGYRFAGWATSSVGAVVYNSGDEYSVDSDIVLYAKWLKLCTKCDGWGYNGKWEACGGCYGLGAQPTNCSHCGGDGKSNSQQVNCSSCGGIGRDPYTLIRCTNCSGNGTVTSYPTCSYCNGSGIEWYTCRSCGGDKQKYHSYPCKTCNSTGIIKQLERIEITQLPETLTFLEGKEELSVIGGKITLYYDDGTSQMMDMLSSMVTGFDNTAVGSQILTVTYNGKTATYNIEIISKELKSIELIDNGLKKEYLEGKDALDIANGTVRLHYNNDTYSDIALTANMISGFNNTVVGEQTLTVTYGEFTDAYTIEIVVKTLESIAVTTLPNKTHYLVGKESFSAEGGKVTLYYNNDTSDIIDLNNSMVSGFSNQTVGVKTLTVTYKGKTDTFDITVDEKTLTSISITTKPTKLSYLEGESFSKTGMVVTAYYNNGTNAVITDYSISGYSSTPGTKTITVTYNGKTDTFTVTVLAKSLSSIAVTAKPSKLTYTEGDEFDKSGMVVTAYYNNNTSGVVTDYTVSGYTSTPGTKTITVAYGGKTTTFTVTVKSGVPQLVTSSKFTVSGNKISKISAGTTVSALLNGISEAAYCKVYNGNSVVSGNSNVGTGMAVKIMDGNAVKASYTVIVTGDTNGDGNITVTDMIAIKAHVLKKSTLSGVYATAADTNGDSGISITDFIQVKAKILGKGSITAR